MKIIETKDNHGIFKDNSPVCGIKIENYWGYMVVFRHPKYPEHRLRMYPDRMDDVIANSIIHRGEIQNPCVIARDNNDTYTIIPVDSELYARESELLGIHKLKPDEYIVGHKYRNRQLPGLVYIGQFEGHRVFRRGSYIWAYKSFSAVDQGVAEKFSESLDVSQGYRGDYKIGDVDIFDDIKDVWVR